MLVWFCTISFLRRIFLKQKNSIQWLEFLFLFLIPPMTRRFRVSAVVGGFKVHMWGCIAVRKPTGNGFYHAVGAKFLELFRHSLSRSRFLIAENRVFRRNLGFFDKWALFIPKFSFFLALEKQITKSAVSPEIFIKLVFRRKPKKKFESLL